jgi:hypothetical protein
MSTISILPGFISGALGPFASGLMLTNMASGLLSSLFRLFYGISAGLA